MFTIKDIKTYLFLDIETIPETKTFKEFNDKKPELAKLFIDKMIQKEKLNQDYNEDDIDLAYRKNASLYPEFSKILTISYGTLKYDDETKTYTPIIKNIIDDDELNVLSRFAIVLSKVPDFKFCGHNIDGFDIPFIIKRMLINNVILPNSLKIHKLKPWETPTVDTMKIWRFGSFEPTSLDILCNTLGIKSPKSSEVNNKVISEIYYNDDLKNSKEIILEYCNKDVIAVMNIVIKLSELID